MDITQSLIAAVNQGRLNEVRNLIKSYGLSYSKVWLDGYVLLCSAIMHKHLKIVKLLLTNGSKVNIVSQFTTYIPLHGAVVNFDNIDIIKMLLDHGANINASNQDGATALHYAIESNKIQIVEYLLKHGADVNGAYKGYKPYFKYALFMKTFSFCNDALREKYEKTPLHFAFHERKPKIFKLLLEHGANVDIEDGNGKTVLYYAVAKGSLPIIQLILNYGPDVNKKSNQNSLYTAIRGTGQKFTEIMDVLLQYGFSVNAEDANKFELLHAAVRNEYFKIFEVLLNYGADVNMLSSLTSETPLHTATKWGREKAVELLIKSGADVNAKDYLERTPVFFSIEKGNLEITKLLLTSGADINAKDMNGVTPIFHYIDNYSLKTMSISDDDDFFPEELNPNGEKKFKEIIKVLVQCGADINASDENGLTLLHISLFREGNANIVMTLLNNGADINIFSKNNETPLELVLGDIEEDYRPYYFKETIEILTQHLIKMKTANLYLNSKNLLISTDGRSDFEDKCKKELEIMKMENIVNKISYHDVLIKNIAQLAKYAKNKNIVDALTSDEYETKFPMYYHMIKNNLRKGLERKELLEEANKFIIFPELPYLCTENIFSYLSNNDLREFACQITKDQLSQ